MKRCSTCKDFFPLTMFGPDKRKRDGLQPQCRTCRRRSALKYTKTEKGKATVRKAKKRYRQTPKGKETERAYKQTEGYKEYARGYSRKYYRREDKQDIVRAWGKSPKKKAYSAQYWKKEENKLRMKAHQRKYNLSEKGKQKMERQRQSPKFREWFRGPTGKAFRRRRNYIRRAQVNAAGVGKVPDGEWQAILEEWNYCCAHCGKPESVVGKLTQDHFIPVKMLGPHTRENILPACQKCNSRKGAKILTHRPQPPRTTAE